MLKLEMSEMVGYHFLKVLVLLLSLQIVLIGSRKLEFILQVEGKPAGLMPANGINN